MPLGLGGVVALAVAGGACWRWYQRRVRLRQRQASWEELSLRLELVPQAGNGRAARGELRESNFLLHDTGADWLVEVPLPQPLLPPGMVLLSREAPTSQPGPKLRPLEGGAAALPQELLSWYVDAKEPGGKVVASQAFLEEAARAVQAHAPLRVEPQRMVQALRAGALLSVSQVREAVKALAATARRWSEVATREGLPQVQPLSPLPPVQAPPRAEGRLRRLARSWRQGLPAEALLYKSLWSALRWSDSWTFWHHSWGALILLNMGVTVFAILNGLGLESLFVLPSFVVLMGSIIYLDRRFTPRRLALCAMMAASNVGAPWVWLSSIPSVFGLRWGEPDLGLRGLALLLWGGPNAVWLARVLVHWRREFRRLADGRGESTLNEATAEKLPAEAAAQVPRVGPNNSCPCGSGRKYKKCHGAAKASG